MTTSERITAAIKGILDEDRRADRERIAELERDLSHMQLRVDLALSADDEVNKQLDEITEKCAALVLEKENARGELVKLRSYAVEHGRLPASGGLDEPTSGPLPWEARK